MSVRSHCSHTERLRAESLCDNSVWNSDKPKFKVTENVVAKFQMTFPIKTNLWLIS